MYITIFKYSKKRHSPMIMDFLLIELWQVTLAKYDNWKIIPFFYSLFHIFATIKAFRFLFFMDKIAIIYMNLKKYPRPRYIVSLLLGGRIWQKSLQIGCLGSILKTRKVIRGVSGAMKYQTPFLWIKYILQSVFYSNIYSKTYPGLIKILWDNFKGAHFSHRQKLRHYEKSTLFQ